MLMATWRRKLRAEVLIHSDQGSSFTSMGWAAFLIQVIHRPESDE